MLKIQEFKNWISQCVSDGQEKLGLDYSDIAYCLLEKSKEIIVEGKNKGVKNEQEKERQPMDSLFDNHN